MGEVAEEFVPVIEGAGLIFGAEAIKNTLVGFGPEIGATVTLPPEAAGISHIVEVGAREVIGLTPELIFASAVVIGLRKMIEPFAGSRKRGRS